jgi:uncharacterized coiled-coil DUF342 family protein
LQQNIDLLVDFNNFLSVADPSANNILDFINENDAIKTDLNELYLTINDISESMQNILVQDLMTQDTMIQDISLQIVQIVQDISDTRYLTEEIDNRLTDYGGRLSQIEQNIISMNDKINDILQHLGL